MNFFLVYNFFVLILMKLQTPMIIVIEQQGARIPGSIPSFSLLRISPTILLITCKWQISTKSFSLQYINEKRDNSKLSYLINRVTPPGLQRVILRLRILMLPTTHPTPSFLTLPTLIKKFLKRSLLLLFNPKCFRCCLHVPCNN